MASSSQHLPTGAYTALVTPMHVDGSVDWVSLDRLVASQLAGGITGLVPCGTTGEAVTLSVDDRKAIISRVIAAARASPRPVVVVPYTGEGTPRSTRSDVTAI